MIWPACTFTGYTSCMHMFPTTESTYPTIGRTAHFIFIVLFFAGILSGVYSQQLIVHTYKSPAPDKEMEELLYISIGLALSKSGYSSTRIASTDASALLVTYERRAQNIHLHMKLGHTENETLLALDYTLDAKIEEAVIQLLERAGLLSSKKRDSPSAGEIAGIFSERPEKPQADQQPEETRSYRLTPVASLSVRGSIFSGASADYFQYGSGGEALFVIRRPRDSLSLSAGLELGYSRLFNNPDMSGGPVHITMAGAEVQAGSGYLLPFRLDGALSGGAAFVSMKTDSKYLHKTVPYMKVGLRILYPLGKAVHAGMDIRYLHVFNPELALTALSPALCISKDF